MNTGEHAKFLWMGDRIMERVRYLFTIMVLALISQNPAYAQINGTTDSLQYADLADLSVDAPIIVRATIKKAIKVDPERALGAPAGTQRYYVIATTNALIRGQKGIPETIRYIIDLPLDSRGRAPKIKKNNYILFARNIIGSTGDIQLVAQDAQILWTPERDNRIRQIVREIVSVDKAPRITAIGSAFHVPGTIIGEGETQIFLETENRQPVSITILRRDGQQKKWAVSLGEIVDEAARAPVRNSLLWYRLACFLPRSLPDYTLTGETPSNANQARLDYRLVIQDLGNCPRARRHIKKM